MARLKCAWMLPANWSLLGWLWLTERTRQLLHVVFQKWQQFHWAPIYTCKFRKPSATKCTRAHQELEQTNTLKSIYNSLQGQQSTIQVWEHGKVWGSHIMHSVVRTSPQWSKARPDESHTENATDGQSSSTWQWAEKGNESTSTNFACGCIKSLSCSPLPPRKRTHGPVLIAARRGAAIARRRNNW